MTQYISGPLWGDDWHLEPSWEYGCPTDPAGPCQDTLLLLQPEEALGCLTLHCGPFGKPQNVADCPAAYGQEIMSSLTREADHVVAPFNGSQDMNDVCHEHTPTFLNGVSSQMAGSASSPSMIRVKRPEITLETLRAVYDKPINIAAKSLNVGVTVLKKECRKLGIKRWPFRKLKSMDKLITSVVAYGEGVSTNDAQQAQEAAKQLLAQRDQMRDRPTLDMAPDTRKLRQANFKYEYKQRQTSQTSQTMHA